MRVLTPLPIALFSLRFPAPMLIPPIIEEDVAFRQVIKTMDNLIII